MEMDIFDRMLPVIGANNAIKLVIDLPGKANQ